MFTRSLQKLSFYACQISAIAAICLSPATANDLANNWTFDRPYAQIGNWRIIHGSELGDTCVAEIDNDQVTLRVMYTVYTGDWFFGNPYYDDDHPMASFGGGEKGHTNDAIQLRSDVVKGWAMFNFSGLQHIFDDLEDGQYLSLKIDRGMQSWKLANKNAAFAKLKECAQSLGKNPSGNMSAASNSGNNCPASGSIKSPASNEQIKITFNDPNFNQLAKTVYWVGYDGKLVEMGPIFDGRVEYTSYAGHKFVVKDFDGKCYGGVHEAAVNNTEFNIR